MIENKTWQHEETGRMTTCSIRPGMRWHEVNAATNDCEQEDAISSLNWLLNRSEHQSNDALLSENKKLRAFAVEIMSAWPEGDIEGGYLQYIAEKHGMLMPETRYEPCGESCHCANYCDSEDWEQGVSCYRRTALLTGEV